MEKIIFLVQGSAKDPYEVTFQKHGNNMSAYCTCPAGKNGLYCKHRINILCGNTHGIISNNKTEVKNITLWLKGTDIEGALNTLIDAEKQYEKSKIKLSAAKKRLVKTFLN